MIIAFAAVSNGKTKTSGIGGGGRGCCDDVHMVPQSDVLNSKQNNKIALHNLC